MKPKILIMPSWYPNDDDLVRGIFFQDQAKVLAEKCDVRVLVSHVVGWRNMLEGKLGPNPGAEEREGLNVYRARGFVPLPRVPNLYFSTYVAAAERGFRRLSSTWGRPDLIHAHGLLPGGHAAVKLSKKHRIPVVLTEHSGPFSAHLRTAHRRRLARITLSGVDHLVAVSPSSMQEIREFQEVGNSSVIGNLVNTRFFVPPENQGRNHANEKLRFLCIALLTEGKGVEYLLAAARKLIEQGMASFELVIGGDGPDRERLEGLAQSMRLAEYCRFVGLLDPGGVRNWMQWCDVFVLPSLHESFGIVLGEAMACGKPVISTHCGGPDYIVTPETGLLVEAGSADALVKGMQSFIEGSVEFDSLRIRESVVERFGSSIFLKNTMALYRRVWGQS